MTALLDSNVKFVKIALPCVTVVFLYYRWALTVAEITQELIYKRHVPPNRTHIGWDDVDDDIYKLAEAQVTNMVHSEPKHLTSIWNIPGAGTRDVRNQSDTLFHYCITYLIAAVLRAQRSPITRWSAKSLQLKGYYISRHIAHNEGLRG